MATLELSILSDHLEEDEIDTLAASIEEIANTHVDFDEDGDSVIVERDIDDDIFLDFQDRLDANDASANVYIPIEFEDVVEIGGRRVGSAHALLIVLENLKEDFFIEDEDNVEDQEEEEGEFGFDDEDEAGGFLADEDSHLEVKDAQLRRVWHAMYRGAQTCVRKSLCMFIHD